MLNITPQQERKIIIRAYNRGVRAGVLITSIIALLIAFLSFNI